MNGLQMSAANSSNLAYHSLEDTDPSWYLGQHAYNAHSWAEHDGSHYSSATAPSEQSWSTAPRGQLTSFDNGNLQPGFDGTYLNPYVSPPATVVDFMHKSSDPSRLHQYEQLHASNGLQIDLVRSASHSPNMPTTMSTSGSECSYATPPPPAASILRAAAAAQGTASAAATATAASSSSSSTTTTTTTTTSRPSNRRRSTAPLAAGVNSEAVLAAQATAERIRERRSGHSAVERKYRENLNGKIEVLRQVLIDAHRSYDAKAQAALSRSAHCSYSQTHGQAAMEYAHSSVPMARGVDSLSVASYGRREGHPPADSVITFAATIGNKKSDVLSSAIHYIKEAEQSRGVLMQQVAFLQGQVVKLESIMSGGDREMR